MKLVDLLKPNLIQLDLTETKRTAAIHQVAGLLEKEPAMINFKGFYDELLARERLEATSPVTGWPFPMPGRITSAVWFWLSGAAHPG